MARVVNPLMSFDASGSIGKALTFAKWKGRNYVKKWFKPANPNTVAQQAIRTVMANAKSYWDAGLVSATTENKALFATAGEAEQISGWNKFVQAYIAANFEQPGQTVADPEVDPVVPS